LGSDEDAIEKEFNDQQKLKTRSDPDVDPKSQESNGNVVDAELEDRRIASESMSSSQELTPR
jgi:hypothetical protein